MITKTPSVGAVIVTYKNTVNVLSLVNDLVKQTVPPREIFIIDNGGGKCTPAFDGFPGVRYITMVENTGSAGGYSEGLRLASADNDYVFTLDDDLRLMPDAIGKLLAGFTAAKGHTRAAILAGRERTFDTGSFNDLSHKTAMADAETPKYTFPELKRYMNFAWRGKLFLSEAIKTAGLPRIDYFLYGDDAEYCFRLANFGYTFYLIPDLIFFDSRKSNKSQLSLFLTSIPVYRDYFRTYYALRNDLNIHLEYKQYPKVVIVIGHSIKMIIGLLLNPASCSKRYLMAIAAGLLDGFRYRLGKNARYLPENK